MIDVPNMRCCECGGPLVSVCGSTFCRPCKKDRLSFKALRSLETLHKRQTQHDADARLGRAVREIGSAERFAELAEQCRNRDDDLEAAAVFDALAEALRKERG